MRGHCKVVVYDTDGFFCEMNGFRGVCWGLKWKFIKQNVRITAIGNLILDYTHKSHLLLITNDAVIFIGIAIVARLINNRRWCPSVWF